MYWKETFQQFLIKENEMDEYWYCTVKYDPIDNP